jgi:hypothetical protein
VNFNSYYHAKALTELHIGWSQVALNFKNVLLIMLLQPYTYNLVIFSLILTRYMFSISKLTRILNIISECDFKHIMALPIKTIITLRLPAILVIISVSTFNTDVILYLYFYIIKYNWNYYYLFNFSYFKLLWLCVYSTLFSRRLNFFFQKVGVVSWMCAPLTDEVSILRSHVKLLICESHAVFTLIFSDHLPHWASDINSLLVRTILY